MEITDEQYNQVIRYVDNEMDAAERQAFETAIHLNIELYEEIKLYQEIRTLSDSADKKIRNACEITSAAENSKDEKIWALLAGARQDWEREHEETVTQEQVITTHQPPTAQIHKSDQIVRMNWFRWMAAAVFTGIVCLSIVWWNAQNKNDGSDVVITKKEAGSKAATNNKADTKNISSPGDTQVLVPSRSVDVPAAVPPSTNYASANRVEQEKKYRIVFQHNFQPDTTPSKTESVLEDPMNLYAEKKYKDAIGEFQLAKDLIITRGPQTYDSLTLFNVHYYMGLNYMASGRSITKAIAELKAANTVIADRWLKTKAQWYLSLAYLKKGEGQKAEALLKNIILHNQNGEYKQKAMELLKDIMK